MIPMQTVYSSKLSGLKLNLTTATSMLAAALIVGVAAFSATAAQSRGNLRVEMGKENGRSAYPPDPQKEKELLEKIASPSTPKNEKAIACKQLTIHGSDAAVPTLAGLLSDPQLASWARIPLEALPGPAAGAALREAAGKLKGPLLVGVLNSLGERRDEKSVKLLSRRLSDPDPEVAGAAAVALGKIGGTASAKVLQSALKKPQPQAAVAIAEGCIRCAEQLLEEGQASQAAKLYDAIRMGRVARYQSLQATRGAILARGDQGIPMLLEELRATDQDRFAIGLSTARELPGKMATEAVAAEVRRSSEERQPLLLLALADRHDPAAVPVVVDAAKNGSKSLRLIAVKVLERLGTLSTVPVLIEVASSPDAGLSQAAIGALVRLPAEGIESDLLKRFSGASDRELEVMIRVAASRQIKGALPLIVKSANSTDAGVRAASMQALGVLASEKEIPELLDLWGKTSDAKRRDELESSILAICSRNRGAVQFVAPLARNADPAARSFALSALSASGGADALTIVSDATKDSDVELQDEAVRALASWPSTWPDDSAVAQPLLDVARAPAKPLHKVLALRGYLQHVEGDTQLSAEQKVAKVRDVLPLMDRPEEKRQAASVLGEISSPAAIELLLTMSEEEAVRQDVCSALLKLASRNVAALPKEVRQKALQAVVEKSPSQGPRDRAAEKLKTLQ